MTFKTPGEPRPDRLSDYLDQPVLIRPKEYRQMDTTMGKSMALMSDAIVLTPDKGAGSHFNLGEIPIFWKGVQLQIDDSIDEWVLGRIHQGTQRNPQAFTFLDPEPEDKEAAEAVLAQLADF